MRETSDELAKVNAVRWWHRIRIGQIYTPGEVHHGPDGGDWPSTRFGIPERLDGFRVLDVGAWDGFFSFEAERRGAAEVVAVDVPQTAGGNWGGTAGFELAKDLLASQVRFNATSIYDLSPDELDQFDLVMCFGVLYHLKHPMLAIERLAAMTAPGGTCLIETARDESDRNAPTWLLRNGYNGDPTNYWYPSIAGLTLACEMAGFTDVRVVFDMGLRCTVAARLAAASV
jgi:tRNA (mo5U34)-methyltransferase